MRPSAASGRPESVTSERAAFDVDAYGRRAASVDCFICAFVRGDARFQHEVVDDDGEHVVFLNRYPTMEGQLLVAPRRHVEHLARDLDPPAWLRLQAVVHRAARTLEAVLPSERTYVLSLGSQQRNRHLHVHVAALPPGVPLADQQHAALMAERGVLQLSSARTEELAVRLRHAFAGVHPAPGAPSG